MDTTFPEKLFNEDLFRTNEMQNLIYFKEGYLFVLLTVRGEIPRLTEVKRPDNEKRPLMEKEIK